ncbi:MAG: hypothetical protein HQ579_02930 [Candidatus Omnitrophica bacterium]|nr:hypothetical protein [Candidatus Omnitrophota bacterium]
MDERHFQIRDCDKRGLGSFLTYTLDTKTDNDTIFQTACDKWNSHMQERERRYFPSFFRQPPKYRPTIKVAEMSKKVIQLPEPDNRGKTHRNIWTTKRGGLKFAIRNNYVQFTFQDGSKKRINGYEY